MEECRSGKALDKVSVEQKLKEGREKMFEEGRGWHVWGTAGTQEGWSLMGSGQWVRIYGWQGLGHLVEGPLVTVGRRDGEAMRGDAEGGCCDCAGRGGESGPEDADEKPPLTLIQRCICHPAKTPRVIVVRTAKHQRPGAPSNVRLLSKVG